MADKIVIEIYKNKTPDEFTKFLADPESKLETASAAAVEAAMSSALLARAADICALNSDGNERIDYIVRNAEILRGYMVHLIDEDVKSRTPLYKAIKGGDEREIEAARQPACRISAEIINMMCKCLELLDELSLLCPKSAMHYIGESAHMAMSAIRSCRLYIINMASYCSDDTYKFVSRRENDITLDNYMPIYDRVIARVENII